MLIGPGLESDGSLCTARLARLSLLSFTQPVQIVGDEWSLPTLAHMIALGMLLSLFPTASYFFYNDDLSLGRESEALEENNGAPCFSQPLTCSISVNRLDRAGDNACTAAASSRASALLLC